MNAHSGDINSVAFNHDGLQIVSGSDDGTIKVWDAYPRPFNASDWEEVDISGMEKDDDGEVEIEGLGYISSNYWKNSITGDLRTDYSTAGKPSALEPIKVWDAGEPFQLLPTAMRSHLMPSLIASQALSSSRRARRAPTATSSALWLSLRTSRRSSRAPVTRRSKYGKFMTRPLENVWLWAPKMT